jgi:WD40 repeat protein
VTALVFAPDAQTLIAGDEHGTLTLCDVQTGRVKTTRNAHRGWVKALVLFGEGRFLASGGSDGFIRLWKLAPETVTPLAR